MQPISLFNFLKENATVINNEKTVAITKCGNKLLNSVTSTANCNNLKRSEK